MTPKTMAAIAAIQIDTIARIPFLDIYLFSLKAKNSLKVVIFRCFVFFLYTTRYAAVGKNIIAVFYSKAYRFHQAATGRGSVTGIHINMPAPQAFWTVIGVAVSSDRGTTMLANEVFNVTLEFFVH